MTKHEWPRETKRRAEAAMSELEAFWERFHGSTPYGRKLELPRLQQIRLSIASVTGADEYVLEILARLADACRQLARERQPANFDESQVRAYGLGDVSNLRGWMAQLGLLEDALGRE